MATTLTPDERAIAVAAGWQAECAVQPHASHLANKMRPISPDICPVTLAACLEHGRKLLRAHLRMVVG